MLTDPIQNDVFREEEFVEIRYRKELLTWWIKLLTGLGVVSSFMSACVSLITPLAKANVDSAELVAGGFFFTVFFAGGISCIMIFFEKKWAIYGLTACVLVHLLVYGAGLIGVKKLVSPDVIYSVLTPGQLLIALLLFFFVNLLLIFKKWLAYQPSKTARRHG